MRSAFYPETLLTLTHVIQVIYIVLPFRLRTRNMCRILAVGTALSMASRNMYYVEELQCAKINHLHESSFFPSLVKWKNILKLRRPLTFIS